MEMRGTRDRLHLMRLLWRSPDQEAMPRSPGPKPRLDIDRVVAAAIDVADANPSGGLSMRTVAARLGVTAMTLYGYVPDKNALVALAYDAIHAEMPGQDEIEGQWRPQVLAWTEELLGLYLRHPWALGVSYARPVLGPQEQRVLESAARVMRGTRLSAELLRRVVGMLFHVVRGTARTVADSREAEETSQRTEDEWWQTAAASLATVVPDFADRFPHTTWLLSEGAESTSNSNTTSYVEQQARMNMRVGLELLMDGLESAPSL